MSKSSAGLDFFNLDVNLFSDAKIIKLMHRYGPIGFMCYLLTLTNVYMNGYYLEASINDLAYVLLNGIGGKYINGKNKLQEIILYLGYIDLIDQDLLSQGIITSRGIQKRFLIATKSRKNQAYDKYWLLEHPTQPGEILKEVKKEQQSKPKKTKKQKIFERKKKDILEHAPKKHYLTSCLIEYRYINEYSLDIYKYNELFEDLLTSYDGDLLYQAVRYLCNYASRPATKIDDRYKFFESSITKNLSRLTNEDSNTSIESWFKSLIG
ncbi:MAG: Lin1244/Lin1753 domain-containing protein [Candidatus Izemoplasma sp.]|nr:Lin1244/Lin1753 domain-containing protein [Candidatus Izemoplasma sp.]